ncbi:MAG: 2-hydroxy-3-oxopropionate reductase [Rhodocyclaceae bacterium]|nr:MAG: 2-hydroxy-3-oxopropionate reductase [Rhodocyclaceae bacterium]TND00782.1 MAG: 2-hydroxy-3-oxopropionate reductase [Rhodocyclaceae bacterium]
MRVGFVGFGAMGRPMAEHLLRAGHALSVWSRRPESAAALLAQGAQWRASPAEVARDAEIVCTNVTGSADVEGLACGPQGLAPGFAAGSLHVDFSTIAPSAARRIATRYAAHGIDFVDAPVSGGSAGAQAATLAIMWGGKSALATRLQPIFEVLGKSIVHVGATGAGQVAKACNQMVMVAAIEAAAEAARLAAAAGIDFAKVRTAMLGGSAGSRVLEVFGERMATREFAAGVEARLHHKDYALLLDEATRIGAPLPVAAAVGQQLNALMALGWGRDDTSSLLRVLEAGGQRGPVR